MIMNYSELAAHNLTSSENKFLTLNFSVFDDKTLPDPSEDEEKIQSGSVTCCIDDQSKIRAMWSSANLSDDVISAALVYVQKRASVLLSVLRKVSKTS